MGDTSVGGLRVYQKRDIILSGERNGNGTAFSPPSSRLNANDIADPLH
jgi:hypothetical protein